MITEEMLCAAAARSCEIYVSYLERGYTPENQHEFSLQFEKKIKKLKRKADHPVFYHATKRIASIVLAILITGGVCTGKSKIPVLLTAHISPLIANISLLTRNN